VNEDSADQHADQEHDCQQAPVNVHRALPASSASRQQPR
jgi:hypothetical protein